MKRRPGRTVIVAVTCLAAMGVPACVPLPIPHDEQVTAYAAGELRRSDGSPIATAPVAITVSFGDTSCAHAAVHSVTNSAGRFELPATRVHKRILWITMLENFGLTSYWLCVGAPDSDRTAHFIRKRMLGPISGDDSITCLEWVQREDVRLTCNTARAREMADGGVWTDGTVRGRYRVILTEEPTRVAGYRVPVARPRAYVQWLDQDGSDPRWAVRTMVPLPIDPKVTALWEVQLLERDAKWHVSVGATKPKFMNDFASAHLMFALGPPGQVTQVDPF